MRHTQATFTHHRYGAEITADAAFRCQLALATPQIDPADLSALLRCDKLAGAARLAALDERALVVQAIACTTFVNETYGFDAGAGVQTEEMLAQFERIVAIYRTSRVEE